MKNSTIIFLSALLIFGFSAFGQNFDFNFNTNGRRVCLVSTVVNTDDNYVRIVIHDSLSNLSEPVYIYRRALGNTEWTNIASALPPGTGHWFDLNVSDGEIWEYQIRRLNTWSYQSETYDAIGYTMGCLMADNSLYKGQLILLVANDIPSNLSNKYFRLKKELTADGWLVNELIVPRAAGWDSGNEVVSVKTQIINIYNNAPANDKPKILFILGHVPLPRSGSTDVTAPDLHDQNKGARGSDAYYADIDGQYTDLATFNPSGLSTPLAINYPDDYKWDQDFFPSDIEMAFGRVDFADLTDITTPELTLIEYYLDRLSNYKNMANGFDMGNKSAFYFGYNNSNDGSYRSLPNISKPDQVYQNTIGANHNEWVKNNGPFKIYMQNLSFPAISDWQNFGMDALVFSSDQSYWGFGDVPQPSGYYSRIRALLGVNTKCLITLWTTTGINIFHQACSGMTLGLAMKDIMNHNTSNQYLEKPPQQYDTEDWWSRTHFAFYGDPSLSLYQVNPPQNLSLTESNGDALLQWTAPTDPEIIGYHIFVSSSELGVYERITEFPVTQNSYVIPNYQFGNWYMVKSVKIEHSGCGVFLHASLGISVEGVFYPTPTATISANPGCETGSVWVYSSLSGLQTFYLTDNDGNELQSATLEANSYEFSGLLSGIYRGKVERNGVMSNISNSVQLTNINIPALPSTINGATNVCFGATENYSVVDDPNANSYSWTLPNGWTGSSNSHEITAVVGASGGEITVSASNTCGQSPNQNIIVTVETIPQQPSEITGETNPCTGGETTYSVVNQSNALFNWTLPNDWSGNSNTNSITASVGSTAGTIEVSASNECGQSAASLLTVNPLQSPGNLSAIAGPSTVPEGSSAEYSVVPLANAEYYMWELSGNWEILGPNSNFQIQILFPIDTEPGILSVKAMNSCGESALTEKYIGITPLSAQSLIPDEFILFPNPSSGVFIIEWKEPLLIDESICVYNSVGQLVFSGLMERGTSSYLLKAAEFPAGNYIIVFQIDKQLFRFNAIVN